MSVKIVESFVFRNVKYQLRFLTCGKKNCTKCPHGPYWYAIVSIPFQPNIIRYIGKKLEGPAEQYRRGAING